ncbi:hypothetical protein BSKO_13707 [Bryopsis sp. KO-2023]|nr:hypothetical protein BSKO_13707 [Bryopsis sp. KO-2023]
MPAHEQGIDPLPSRVIGFAETYGGRGPRSVIMEEEEDFFTQMHSIFAPEFEGPLDDRYESGACLAESDLFYGMGLREKVPEVSQIEISQAGFSDNLSKPQTLMSSGKSQEDTSQSFFHGQTSEGSSHHIEGASLSTTGLSVDKGADQCGEKADQVAGVVSSDQSGATEPSSGEKKPDSGMSMIMNEIMSVATPELDEGKAPAFTGVVKHSRNRRWEAHIWIPSLRKQVYLGCYDSAVKAATAYDMAVLCDRGRDVATNLPLERQVHFPPVGNQIKFASFNQATINLILSNKVQSHKSITLQHEGDRRSQRGDVRYAKFLDLVAAEEPTVKEVLTLVRRFSNGFTRGNCKFRGVTKHPNGHWEARIGVSGNRNIYLGLHQNEADAGRSYDRARVRMKGPSATTNFPISDYLEEAKEHDRWRKVQTLTVSR